MQQLNGVKFTVNLMYLKKRKILGVSSILILIVKEGQMNPSEHHTGHSPLLDIKPLIDMIKIFPLDYMHLLCLGATKKLYINDLLFETSVVKLRLNERQIIMDRMKNLKYFACDEFQRKP